MLNTVVATSKAEPSHLNKVRVHIFYSQKVANPLYVVPIFYSQKVASPLYVHPCLLLVMQSPGKRARIPRNPQTISFAGNLTYRFHK